MSFLEKWLIGEPEPENKIECGVVAEQRPTVLEIAPPVVSEKAIITVAPQVILPPPPAKPVLPPDNLVKPFGIRSIEHAVTVDGNEYHVRVSNFNWLSSGYATYAKVVISLPGRWSVESRGTLTFTHGGRAYDDTNDMIGAFANAGLTVQRRLIDACLYPIQNQVLEIERQLKGFS